MGGTGSMNILIGHIYRVSSSTCMVCSLRLEEIGTCLMGILKDQVI